MSRDEPDRALAEAVNALEDIARYARARGLRAADQMLADLLALLHGSADRPDPDGTAGRAKEGALRLLPTLRAPDEAAGAESGARRPTRPRGAAKRGA